MIYDEEKSETKVKKSVEMIGKQIMTNFLGLKKKIVKQSTAFCHKDDDVAQPSFHELFIWSIA